jgi:hypothetical protein
MSRVKDYFKWSTLVSNLKKASLSYSSFTNRCTFINVLIKIYIKLDGSYMFRSTTIIRELAIDPG